MRIIRLFIAVSVLAVSAFAQLGNLNFDKMRYGEENFSYSARMLGLAGSGMALQGALGQTVANPALAVTTQKGLTLQAGFALNKSVENREYPYYDSFVGFNDYGSYAYNNNWYYGGYFHARYLLPKVLGNPLAVQAGWQPFRDFRYDYVEEVRDPVDKTDKLLGYNWLKEDGLLQMGYAGIAYRVLPKLSVGISVGFLMGDIDSTRHTEPKVGEGVYPRLDETRSRTLSGTPFLFNAGLHYQLSERMALAFAFRAPYEIRFDASVKKNDGNIVKFTETITYPTRLGLGVDYRFQNILQARVFADFYYEFWSNFSDSRLNTGNYRDIYIIRTGVEHIFFDTLPFRIGFAFNPLPQNRDLTRTLITIGTGWQAGALRIDAAAGLTNQQYFQNDIFPNSLFGLSNRTDMDRVTWTQYFLRLDFRYALFK